jgi:hypothetical protein
MPSSVKITLPDGRVVDGVNVDILESVERWSEVKLSDGAELRVKMSVLAVSRALNEFDPQGNPFYTLNLAPLITVAKMPDELKKP